MKHGPHSKRPRGRTRRNNNNNANRHYDSNGPDVRIRGTASQIFDKYHSLARDASSSGDRVLAESHLQHAEHYFRIMLANNSANGRVNALPGDALFEQMQATLQADDGAEDGEETGDGTLDAGEEAASTDDGLVSETAESTEEPVDPRPRRRRGPGMRRSRQRQSSEGQPETAAAPDGGGEAIVESTSASESDRPDSGHSDSGQSDETPPPSSSEASEAA